MKILLLSNLFVPFTRGGAERIVELQANVLAQAGHDVLVVSPTPDARFIESTLDSGVRVARFRFRNLYFTLKDFAQPFWKRALWHLIDLYHPHPKRLVRQVIAKEQPDLVITHNMKGFGLRAFEGIGETGVPHIHVLHDLQLIVPSGLKFFGKEDSWQARGWLQRSYVKAVRRRVGSPRLVLSPSQFLLDEHQRAGIFPKSTQQLLPNPAPWDDLSEKKIELSQTPLVLYVGQLGEHKGLKVLMEAWEKGMGANLGIIGAGELKEQMDAFAKEYPSVTAYGRKSPKEVRAFMSRARVLVVPSLCYENAPTVVMEALSVGTPVVVSDIGGIPELIKEGEGLLVEPGNPGALREAIKKQLATPLDRDKVKASSQRFSLERYKEELLKLIESLD